MARLARAEVVEDERVGEELLEPLLDRSAEDRPRGRHRHEGVHVGALARAFQRLDEGQRHGVAHEVDRRDLLLLHRADDALGVEAGPRDDDRRAAREHAHPGRELARAVDVGRRGQDVLGVVLLHRVARELLGALDGVPPGRAALQEREEQVLVAPHHALGHAGRAAGVDDVQLIAGALLEVPLATFPRQDRVVVERIHALGRHPGAVLYHDHGAHAWLQVTGGAGDLGVALVHHDRLEVGVVEQVGHLVRDVAVVDVDVHRAELHAGEHGLDVFGAVVHEEADVVARADAPGPQEVGESVGPVLELGEREAALSRDQRLLVRHDVDERLEEVRDVVAEAHGLSFPTIQAAKNWLPPP